METANRESASRDLWLPVPLLLPSTPFAVVTRTLASRENQSSWKFSTSRTHPQPSTYPPHIRFSSGDRHRRILPEANPVTTNCSLSLVSSPLRTYLSPLPSPLRSAPLVFEDPSLSDCNKISTKSFFHPPDPVKHHTLLAPSCQTLFQSCSLSFLSPDSLDNHPQPSSCSN